MKSFFSIACVLLYFGFNSGLGLDFHYCGSQFSSVAISGVEIACCCGPAEEKGCCSTETLVLQSDDDQHTSTTISVPGQPEAIATGWAEMPLPQLAGEAQSDLRGRDPPPPNGPPFYIQHARLILYG